MKIEIPLWSAHYNQILYSLLIYTQKTGENFEVCINTKIPPTGAILLARNKVVFLDYSDDFLFLEDYKKYDFYFKRSLAVASEYAMNIKPLNFQINFSYQPFNLISKFESKLLLSKYSRVEFVRALDYFSLITRDSHQSKNIAQFVSSKEDNRIEGKVLFMTRLWDPSRATDNQEKERRILQNDFRINTCRIIKKFYPNSTVGIFPDKLAIEKASDVVLDVKSTSKKRYLEALRESDIAIADNGLKNSTGWKIGEYILAQKAIITTPLTTVAEDFDENRNYYATTNRNDYNCIPDLVNKLLSNKAYEKMQLQNKVWSEKYLIPEAYIKNILDTIK